MKKFSVNQPLTEPFLQVSLLLKPCSWLQFLNSRHKYIGQIGNSFFSLYNTWLNVEVKYLYHYFAQTHSNLWSPTDLTTMFKFKTVCCKQYYFLWLFYMKYCSDRKVDFSNSLKKFISHCYTTKPTASLSWWQKLYILMILI